jgi:GNAT superfamily N-acetyltransferase
VTIERTPLLANESPTARAPNRTRSIFFFFFFTIVRIDKDDHGKAIGLFSTTFVAPEFRRQAVATRLLSQGEDWMRGHGMIEAATYTSDSNTKLINLYIDHGYKITNKYPEKKMIKLTKVFTNSPISSEVRA